MIDMSGSMKSGRNLTVIPEKVHTIVTEHCKNLDNARFVLLGTGMMMSDLRGSSPSFAHTYGLRYEPKEFESLLIRSLSEATAYPEAKRMVETICRDGRNFKYERSFASLARPISVYYLIKQEQFDFSQYRDIYHIEVTDDGETNDQWSLEYNFLRKHYPEHFKNVNSILPSIACSRFDFLSKQSGNFEEIFSSREQPYVYLTQYFTYEDDHPDAVLSVDSLVEVSDFHDRHLTLRMRPGNDNLHFVVIDTCRLNGHPLAVNQYLYPSGSVDVPYEKSVVNALSNTLYVDGSYQEEYNDRILGRRYRVVPFHGEIADSFVSVETKSIEKTGLYILGALLLALIILTILRRNLVALCILVNGKCYRIKYKAMLKLRNDSYTLLTVHFKDDVITNTHFYIRRGISVKDLDASALGGKEREELNHNGILIKSSRKLTPVFPDVVYDVKANGREIIVSELSGENDGDEIQFSYANRLSHNLIVRIVDDSAAKNEAVAGDNALLQLNTRMISSFISSMGPDDKRHALFNNVLVNIIRKNTLGGDYVDDYAILNIFDFNSRNTANRIFLRYSLVCFFDSGRIAVKDVYGKLVSVARYVLRSERQKMGFFDVNLDDKPEKGDIEVDISPMSSYLYLLKKGKSRLVYSPFADGKQPLSDGSFGLTNKTVKVYPKCKMILLNLPFKYRHPEMEKDGPNGEVFDKVFRESEVLTFLGNDKVRFLNVEMDWSLGDRTTWMGGITYRAWSFDAIMNGLSKQK